MNNNNNLNKIEIIKEEDNNCEKSQETDVAQNERYQINMNTTSMLSVEQNVILIQGLSGKPQISKQAPEMFGEDTQNYQNNIPDNVSFGRISPTNDEKSVAQIPTVKVSQINFEGIPFQTKFIVSRALLNPLSHPNSNPKRLNQIQQLQSLTKYPKYNEFPIVKECQVMRKKRSNSIRNIEQEEQQMSLDKSNKIDIFQFKQNNNSNSYNNVSTSINVPPSNGNAFRIKKDISNSFVNNDFQESYCKISYRKVSDNSPNQQSTRSQNTGLLKREINNSTEVNNQQINVPNNFQGNKYGKPLLNRQHPLIQLGQKQNSEIVILSERNYSNSTRFLPQKSKQQTSITNHRSLRNSPNRSEQIDNQDENYNTVQQIEERTPLTQINNSSQINNKNNNYMSDENNLESEINLTHRSHLKHLDQKTLAKKINSYKKYINQLEGLLLERKQEDKKQFFSSKKNKSSNGSNFPQSNHHLESEIFKQNKSTYFEKSRPTTSAFVSRNTSLTKSGTMGRGESQNGCDPNFITNGNMSNLHNLDVLQQKNSVFLQGLDLDKKEIDFTQKHKYLPRQRFTAPRPSDGVIEDIIQKRNSLQKDIYSSVIGTPSLFEEQNSKMNKSIDYIQNNKSKNTNKLEKDVLTQNGKQKEAINLKKQSYMNEQIRQARQHIEEMSKKTKSKEKMFNNNSCFIGESNRQKLDLKEFDFHKKLLFDKTASFAMFE